MPKKKVIALACSIVAALLLFGLVFAYLTITETEKNRIAQQSQMKEEYQKENSHVYALGETFILDSKEDDAGAEGGYVASFDWLGKMELTFTKAELFASPLAAGIDDDRSNPGNYDSQDWCFLLVEVRMRNIDGDYRNQEFKNRQISFVHLIIDEADLTADTLIAQMVYFDGTKPGALPKEYYSYDLDVGEAKTYRIGFMLPQEAYGREFSLRLGNIPHINKYLVELGNVNQTAEKGSPDEKHD
ncbi:MAG: hypothetical protein LBG81_06625 [Coriobacteriaceae bacterium]|nr:hypothetical protein [Coriobacteriaceae bacterium]